MNTILAAIRRFFAPPTLEQAIENETRKHTLEVMQCDNVIRSHEFQKHMAKANLAALESWNHRDDRS